MTIMLKEMSFFAVLIAMLYCVGYTQASYKLMTNPPGYGKYTCPDKYKRMDLDYNNRKHWTLMVWGSPDKPECALKGTKAYCKKPTGKRKFWMTYAYGYGEFHISKFDHFSDMSYSYSSTIIKPSGGYSSSSLVPQYFAVRALYFKIRGATEIEITFSGEITKTIKISGSAIDWRKKTWICIQWETFPIFKTIWITFVFERKKKAKLWDLYIFACCEIMKDGVVIGKK